MTADVTDRLDEIERYHAAWQVGGWDGFEGGIRGMAAVPELVAGVRAVLELADELDRVDELFEVTDRIRSALAAALAPQPDQDALP